MGNKKLIITLLGYLCLTSGWLVFFLVNEGYNYSGILFGIALGFFISNLISDKNAKEKK